jgi:hypothetical protein
MLGGYPRLVTEARMTSRIVRCRSVSPESPDRALRADSESGVSLSLIRTNVAASGPDIKHVFEACRVPVDVAGRKVVGAVSYRLLCVQQFDHMFGIRTHYRLCFEQVIDTSRVEERT